MVELDPVTEEIVWEYVGDPREAFYSEAGGSAQVRHVMRSRSYLAQVETTATFGLGDVDVVDALRVRWPDGHEQAVEVVGLDRELLIRRE